MRRSGGMQPVPEEEDSASQASSSEETQKQLGSKEKTVKGNYVAKVIRKESTAVFGSKVFLYTVLFMAAVAVGLTTYFILKDEDTERFHSEFNALADDIFKDVEENFGKTVEAVGTLSVAITSYIVDHQLPRPFTYLPHFEYRGEETRRLARAEYIAYDVPVGVTGMKAWEMYAYQNQGWIREGLDYLGKNDVDPGKITGLKDAEVEPEERIDDPVFIQARGNDTMHRLLWQMSPAPTDASVVMQDLLQVKWFRAISTGIRTSNATSILSKVVSVDFLTRASLEAEEDDAWKEPRSVLSVPYYRAFDVFNRTQPGGHILAILPWRMQFTNVLPPGADGFIVVVSDECGTVFTYEINGADAKFLGYGDLHDYGYDHLRRRANIAEFGRFTGGLPDRFDSDGEISASNLECRYLMEVYPSAALEGEYDNGDPVLYSILVVLVFVFTALVFLLYEYAVQRRQNLVLSKATRTEQIVSSLFPENVQQRILDEARAQADEQGKKRGFNFGAKQNLKQFLKEGEQNRESVVAFKTKPIADLFPETTVMFADMVGFTAWSSARDPASVFTLLETVYHAFDQIAVRRRVFKVETVGDCYVAVAGLPEPRKDHAVVMARFARDCLQQMKQLTTMLEESLGPDTADLNLRIGLHSGPVTAGVLRGERARFQLFGDTMNTTSRMESTGQPGRIHVSQETASLLIEAGKGVWLRRRSDKVKAKGKGELTTFWLEIKGAMASSSHSSGNSDEVLEDDKFQAEPPEQSVVGKIEGSLPGRELTERHTRLVNWNTEILAGLLKHVIARRKAAGVEPDPEVEVRALETSNPSTLVLEEVVEVITLPQFRAAKDHKAVKVELGQDVMDQLHDYVQAIALLYKENPFHNFEHVSHVTMSVVKLLGRIVAPEIKQEDETDVLSNQKTLHDHTYGITSDPLTQFAVVFSALIHDVDHTGLPNSQLVKEQKPVAVRYKNRSVAEQNSVDVAWWLLMDPRFDLLRRAIYVSVDEFKRFRQLVANAVMATDIIDKELGAARKERWNKAFAAKEGEDALTEVDTNRKATIVIEHLIQASDVAHTMQHWHIYRKWNTRLFQEMYKAYRSGHSDKDPSEFWYEGELGFFDYYIIPLAKKLKDCGVFGVSSDEYLTYATQNRKEWESRGREVVAELSEGASRLYNRFGGEQRVSIKKLTSSTSVRELQ